MADSELAELQLLVAALAARVVALEERPTSSGLASDSFLPTDSDSLWALTELRRKRPEHPSTEAGAVMIVGSLSLPGGAPIEWQQGAGTADLFELDWSDRAAGFAALAHPVRLELLRQVLLGVRATADLAAIESLGTTGQLHHHLRQLLSTGWLKHSGRGTYDVPPARVVPLLACLVAVER